MIRQGKAEIDRSIRSCIIYCSFSIFQGRCISSICIYYDTAWRITHFHKGEGDLVKGYYVPNGYMGFVEGKYILFVSESEYYEYMKGE